MKKQSKKRGVKTIFPATRINGFSIVEILVAMGLMTIGSLAMTQLMVQSIKQTRSVALSSEFNSLVSQLQLSFDTQRVCKMFLENQDFRDGISRQTPQNIEDLYLRDPANSPTIPVVQVGRRRPDGLTVNKLQFVLQTLIPFDTRGEGPTLLKGYQATIRLETSKDPIASVGSPMQKKEFPLKVYVDNNRKIKDCYSNYSNFSTVDPGDPDRGPATTVISQICEDMGGEYYPELQFPKPRCLIKQLGISSTTADRDTTLAPFGPPARPNKLPGLYAQSGIFTRGGMIADTGLHIKARSAPIVASGDSPTSPPGLPVSTEYTYLVLRDGAQNAILASYVADPATGLRKVFDLIRVGSTVLAPLPLDPEGIYIAAYNRYRHFIAPDGTNIYSDPLAGQGSLKQSGERVYIGGGFSAPQDNPGPGPGERVTVDLKTGNVGIGTGPCGFTGQPACETAIPQRLVVEGDVEFRGNLRVSNNIDAGGIIRAGGAGGPGGAPLPAPGPQPPLGPSPPRSPSTCPDGQYVYGIDGSGQVLCRQLPAAAAPSPSPPGRQPAASCPRGTIAFLSGLGEIQCSNTCLPGTVSAAERGHERLNPDGSLRCFPAQGEGDGGNMN